MSMQKTNFYSSVDMNMYAKSQICSSKNELLQLKCAKTISIAQKMAELWTLVRKRTLSTQGILQLNSQKVKNELIGGGLVEWHLKFTFLLSFPCQGHL